MLNRVTSLLIGKDIDRSAGVLAGESFVAFADGASALASGEIVVLDKNLKVLSAGATVADTEVIYIAQGTANTFDAGSLTGIREILLSDPIEGRKVKNFSASAFTPKVEQTSSLTLTGMTPVAGTEYIVRIIYKDIYEHPGEFTHSYRYIATAAAAADIDVFGAAIAAKVNAHSGRRVNAAYNTTTNVLSLVGREITECCTSLNDIDKFTMVEFDVFFNYVTSDGDHATWPSTSTTVTKVAAVKGSGNWEQIRDLERSLLSHKGITNTTHFPVIKPDYATVVNTEYDMIVIEHDKSYLSPDNAYVKAAPMTTIIAVANGALQTNNILGQLNPYMASVNFNAVTI